MAKRVGIFLVLALVGFCSWWFKYSSANRQPVVLPPVVRDFQAPPNEIRIEIEVRDEPIDTELQSLVLQLQQLGDTDQASLDRLNNSLFSLIQRSPDEMRSFIRKLIPRLQGLKPEVGFFFLNAWFLHGSAFETELVFLLNHTEPDEESTVSSGHHRFQTAAHRLSRYQAFGIRRHLDIVRQGLRNAPKMDSPLFQALLEQAKGNPNENILRESIRAVLYYSDDSDEVANEILGAISQDQLEICQDLLL